MHMNYKRMEAYASGDIPVVDVDSAIASVVNLVVHDAIRLCGWLWFIVRVAR